VWVTNTGDGTVSKLRVSDGKVLGTFAVGSRPTGIAFDGANMWVGNRSDGTVSKLRASDGKLIGTFDSYTGAYGIAFDGSSIWIAGDPYVVELRASDAAKIGLWDGAGSIGAAFDGANVWITRLSDNAVHKF
jgi:DNA-binding beta-propeller fold protein YncE